MMFYPKTPVERNVFSTKSKKSFYCSITFLLSIAFSLTALTGCSDNSHNNSSIQTTEITTTTATSQTTTESIVTSETAQSADIIAAEDAACTYYKNTVFEVKSMEVTFSNDNIVKFTVYVMKDGKECVPRTIEMQKKEGKWEMINEGY